MGVTLGTFLESPLAVGAGRPFRRLTAARTSSDATREADKAVAAATEGGILLTSTSLRSEEGEAAKPASRGGVAGQSRVLFPGSWKLRDAGRGRGDRDVER